MGCLLVVDVPKGGEGGGGFVFWGILRPPVIIVPPTLPIALWRGSGLCFLPSCSVHECSPDDEPEVRAYAAEVMSAVNSDDARGVTGVEGQSSVAAWGSEGGGGGGNRTCARVDVCVCVCVCVCVTFGGRL